MGTPKEADVVATEPHPAPLSRNRSFLLLWAGQLVSQMGDRLAALAFPWLVYSSTGSELGTAVVFVCSRRALRPLLLLGQVLRPRHQAVDDRGSREGRWPTLPVVAGALGETASDEKKATMATTAVFQDAIVA